MMAAILKSAILEKAILDKKKLQSLILTQLDDIFSQIHSKTLSLHSDSDSNLFNMIILMLAAIFNSAILNCAILDSAILHKTLTQTNSIWLKLIHSHSMW